MKFFKYILVILILLNIHFTYSVLPEIEIVENASFLDLENGNYSILSNGLITIRNPSINSTIYEVNIPMNMDTYMFFQSKSPSNSKVRFLDDAIRVNIIGPGENLTFGYEIFGLVSYDLKSSTYSSSSSILEYYSNSEIKFVPKVLISLDKITRENESSSVSGRYVLSRIRNNEDFNLTVNNLTVYKSDVSNPIFFNGSVIADERNFQVESGETIVYEYYDINSSNSSVYWVSSDVSINYNLTSSTNEYVIVSNNDDSGGGGRSSGNFGPVLVDSSGDQAENLIINSLIVKREANASSARPGDTVEITISIVNNNNFILRDLILQEELTSPYLEIIDNLDFDENNNLELEIDEVGAYSVYSYKYKVKISDDALGVSIVKPTRVEYLNSFYFSKSLFLIHEDLSKKRLFMQKEIDIIDDNFAKVTIKVRNLGNVDIDDLFITDNIDDELIIKQISQIFHDNQRGVWTIDKLGPLEEWEVSYLIERNNDLETLPSVFGIEKSEVFAILISNKEVVFEFDSAPLKIEQIGLGIALGLLIFYLLF